MSCCKLPPYVVLELPNISESIRFPIQNVQRIRYTCFDVSKTLIVFGATSGGIYVFNRNPCEFIQLIPNKDGTITRLAISPDEKHIGFANGKGIVTVTACKQSLSGGHSTTTSKEHQGNEVTSMVWGPSNMLFAGDDVGKISVLQLQGFIAKAMFQSLSQTIISLDSRICQLDVKNYMLLVSTLTRCYICDTLQEQYRQIGQKLRDGDFGACFYNKEKITDNNTTHTVQDITEVKKYNIVDNDAGFAVSKDLVNTVIFCARPSSRLWEASIEGNVIRTHQFKQVLAKQHMKLISLNSYNSEVIDIRDSCDENDGQSINFQKIFKVNGAIFSFKKDALYFLNVNDVDDTTWYKYNDILDCKVYNDMVYVWLNNGSLVNLKYMKIEKFLLKSYVDKKYVLCAELCALYSNYLLNNNLSPKLHILVGIRDNIDKEKLKDIEKVLEKFDGLKSNEATQMKSGIFVVDNTYQTQSSLLDDEIESPVHNEENKFGTISPEALQAFKDLSVTVSDKLISSKKILKDTWEGMKHFHDTQPMQEITALPKRIIPEDNSKVEYTPVLLGSNIIHKEDNNIIHKESSQKAIEVDNNVLESEKVCKSLYQYFRLSIVGKETDRSNLVSIVDSFACDISGIYDLMLLLEHYCISVNAIEESKYVPNNIFLMYLSSSPNKDVLLDRIIKDEDLYKYFVDSCISVNMKTQKLSNIGCECGFPLPYTRTNQMPEYSGLIDEFIEKQWSSPSRDQCYEVCKRMPYLWRKILYLRRNEDLLNVLRILLQMLDEGLLHSFLPQFTLESWDRALQLYATLHANMCLNCNKKFHHISVKDMLSWDDVGSLMIKSVGGRNALKIMQKHARAIDIGELTMKFYHTSMLTALFEKYDVTVTNQLVDTLYSCYDNEEVKMEICRLLRSTTNGFLKNTALPIVVAANSLHWGMNPIREVLSSENSENPKEKVKVKTLSFKQIIQKLPEINNDVTDCVLCGLPLQNEVLIQDGGLWVFKCGHCFHGACLDVNKVKLCPSCPKI